MRRDRFIDRRDSDVEHLGGYRPPAIRKRSGITPAERRGPQNCEIVIIRIVPKRSSRLAGAIDPWFEQEEDTTEIMPGRGSIGGRVLFMDPFEGRLRRIY